MYRALSLTLALAIICCCFGCASSKSLDNFNGNGNGGSGGTGGTGGTGTGFHTGNWAFKGTGGIHGTLNFGGYLTLDGTGVLGTLYTLGSDEASGYSALDYTTSLGGPNATGTFSNGTLTVTISAASNHRIALNFTGISSNSSTLNGTYTVTGGADDGDSGTLSGVEVTGSDAGTWTGTDPVTGGTVTVSMTEAASETVNIYPLTISGASFGGVSGCSVTFSRAYLSYAAGNIVYLNLGTLDSGFNQSFAFYGTADSATAPKVLNGWYTYANGTSCLLEENNSQLIPFTFTKQ